jgi:hypothetical protein
LVLLEKIKKTINNLYRSKQIDIEATAELLLLFRLKMSNRYSIEWFYTYFLSFRQTSCKMENTMKSVRYKKADALLSVSQFG